jgi:Cof subfamily protein (haloacid dehalogenase superfamily)
LDLDGTLLCKQGEISDQNLHALDEVRDCGIEIVVATGRSYEECKHIVQSMNHVGVCITAGGSQLTDCNGGALARDVVDKSVVKEVTDAVLEYNHRCLLLKDATVCDTQYVLVGDAPLHAASQWWFESLGITATEVRTIQEDPWPEMTLRVGAIASGEALSPIAKSLEVILKDRAKLQHWSAVTCSEATGSSTHLLEVFGKTVNKWAMLRQHLGSSLDRTRIAAIGDGLNDIEVLKEAGLSIVMENADEHVKRHANVITGHHDGSGFVDAMRRWIIPRLEVL